MWHPKPPDVTDDRLIWVIDGSRKYAAVWETATTGCGVAVIRDDGTLVAFAHATPPPWVRTASAAEAWALSLVVKSSPFAPRGLAACKAVVDAAWVGTEAATAANRPNARIWWHISRCVDDDFGQLRRRIVWLPAHTACDAVGARYKSDGTKIRVAEWRANQLADALAKRSDEGLPPNLDLRFHVLEAKLKRSPACNRQRLLRSRSCADPGSTSPS